VSAKTLELRLTCDSCPCFDKFPEEGQGLGLCRFKSPAPAVVVEPEAHNAIWPIVDGNQDWCREHPGFGDWLNLWKRSQK
jgi:hypothetical protein